jgi:hypothetical protein
VIVPAGGVDFTWTRRVVLALVVVVLSLAGHAAGSSLLPSWPGLLFATALASGLTVAVGVRTSALRLFGFILGVEALLHVVFVVSSDCYPAGGTTSSLLPSSLSLLGHVAAAIVAVAVLRHGDQALTNWSVLLRAAFEAPELILGAVPDRSVPAAPAWDARTFGADSPLSMHSRRGPPPPR